MSVVHSTSWRLEAGVGVVLTYAALPDPDPDGSRGGAGVPDCRLLGGPRLLQPPGLHGHHVASHAVRHLSDLLGHDPTVAEAAQEAGHTDLWGRVRRTVPARSGAS